MTQSNMVPAPVPHDPRPGKNNHGTIAHGALMVHSPVERVQRPKPHAAFPCTTVQYGQWPSTMSLMFHGPAESIHSLIAHGTQPCTTWSMVWYNIVQSQVTHVLRPGRTCPEASSTWSKALYNIVNGLVQLGPGHGNS